MLAAADTGAKVVAVGCLAERYGAELAAGAARGRRRARLRRLPRPGRRCSATCVDGHRPAAHTPVDRRLLLPISPGRPAGRGRGAVSLPRATRRRPARRCCRTLLHAGPVAPLKIASGCDRRCTFCAIPSFRGAFVSRPADEIVAEAGWLAGQGVREIVLVSENSTSYGKDLPGERQLEDLLAALAAVPGHRPGAAVLPAAGRDPALADRGHRRASPASPTTTTCPSSTPPNRCCAGCAGTARATSFLRLVDQIRAAAPEAGIRSNVIVGFPGETEDDLAELEAFLIGARMDAVGVFGYSDEDGTAAADLPDKLDDDVIAERVERVTSLVEELTAQRAEDRIGTELLVLVDDRIRRGSR